MHVRRNGKLIEVVTPAKINLFLEVLAKRPDGFHEIETVLTAIAVYDSLILTPTESREIKLDCRWACGLAAQTARWSRGASAAHELLYGEIPDGGENLVWRAVELLRTTAGVQEGADIQLIKRIPAAAGLGGASSDAAAALVAANLAWNLDWPRDRLMGLAAELGSDVPFFLSGGAAVGRGRGEMLEPMPTPRLHTVVVRPPAGLSTPRVYQNCRPTNKAPGVQGLVARLSEGRVAEAVKHLANDLEAPAAELTPWMGRLRREFDQQPVLVHQMSGSGSSYFALCRTARQARQIAARLRSRNLGAVFSTTTAVAT